MIVIIMSLKGKDQSNPGVSCKDLKNKYQYNSGYYWINFFGTSYKVYCDMDTDGGK